MHREWLELLQREGAFLSVPVLKSVWPTGVPALTDKEKMRVVRDAFEAFVPAWDAWHADVLADGAHSVQRSFVAVRHARDKWVEAVLTELVGWAPSMRRPRQLVRRALRQRPSRRMGRLAAPRRAPLCRAAAPLHMCSL